VLADLETSQAAGSLYCGIYAYPYGELIGVVDYLPAGFEGNPKHAFLELLMIARPFRGRGLGNQIIADLEAEIRKDPRVSAIRLGVQVNNPGVLSFWQRCGYKIIRPAELQPDQTIAYLMEKQF
jgi:ribosomal protein S18 acetylase RimI-like enzyme